MPHDGVFADDARRVHRAAAAPARRNWHVPRTGHRRAGEALLLEADLISHARSAVHLSWACGRLIRVSTSRACCFAWQADWTQQTMPERLPVTLLETVQDKTKAPGARHEGPDAQTDNTRASTKISRYAWRWLTRAISRRLCPCRPGAHDKAERSQTSAMMPVCAAGRQPMPY